MLFRSGSGAQIGALFDDLFDILQPIAERQSKPFAGSLGATNVFLHVSLSFSFARCAHTLKTSILEMKFFLPIHRAGKCLVYHSSNIIEKTRRHASGCFILVAWKWPLNNTRFDHRPTGGSHFGWMLSCDVRLRTSRSNTDSSRG